MLKTDEIIDYAMPLMNIERRAKEIHNLCLEHKYDEAHEAAMRLGAEAKLLQHALTIIGETEKAWNIPSHLRSALIATKSN